MTQDDLVRWIRSAYESGEQSNINGVWYNFDCPVCDDRGKNPRPTLGLNTMEGWFHCFRCGSKGRSGEVEQQAKIMIAVDPDFDRKRKMILPRGYTVSKPGMKSWAYLTARGLTPTIIEEAMLGEVPNHPRYKGRALVPWWSWGDALGGFAARIMPGEEVDIPESKYLYPKGMSRTDLYCAEELFAPTDEPCFIVEGSFDALAVWPDGVAIGGSPGEKIVDRIAEAQETRAVTLRRPLIIAFDADAARKTDVFVAQLRRRFAVQVEAVKLPKGINDLGDLAGKHRVIQRVKEKSLGWDLFS